MHICVILKCGAPANCTAPCDCGKNCWCEGTKLVWFCAKHFDKIIGGMKAWAAGLDTPSRQRRALQYLRNHPEL